MADLTTPLVLPRPAAKRSAALAIINALSNAASVYASFLYSGMYHAPLNFVYPGCGTNEFHHE